MQKVNNNEPQILTAIDLGSTCIRVMAAVMEDNALRILGYEQKPTTSIHHGIAENTTTIGFDVQQCIKLLENRIGNSIGFQQGNAKKPTVSIFTAVGGRTMRTIDVTAKRDLSTNRMVSDAVLNDMQNECRSKLQRGQDVAVFSVIPHHYIINGDVENPLTDVRNSTANTVEGFYRAVVGNVALRERTEGGLDRAGVGIENVSLKMDALASALLTDRDKAIGCAILDMGGETTSLGIYKNGRLEHVEVVPLGSQHITKDIQSVGISEANAEKLKLCKGMAMESLVSDPVLVNIPAAQSDEPTVRIDTRFLGQIIEARLREIITPLFAVLQSYETELEGELVLTGGGSMLSGMKEFVEQYTSLPVVFGSHAEWLAADTDERYFSPQFSQLVGTLAIADEYWQQHNTQAPKPPKIGFFDKAKTGLINFFSDDE